MFLLVLVRLKMVVEIVSARETAGMAGALHVGTPMGFNMAIHMASIAVRGWHSVTWYIKTLGHTYVRIWRSYP